MTVHLLKQSNSGILVISFNIFLYYVEFSIALSLHSAAVCANQSNPMDGKIGHATRTGVEDQNEGRPQAIRERIVG